jgi:hypothetical protein
MITCERFRREFGPGCEDALLLEHLRSCDACLTSAVDADPDAMFRAIGGAEMIPPGGVDAFVSDVMREVHLRSTENSIEPAKKLGWMRRLAVAATLLIGTTAALVYYPRERVSFPPVARAQLRTASKPVIENYESQNATIVEVPAETQGDVKIVMIFDESLPADL